MKYRFYIILIFIITSLSFGQDEYILSGHVTDKETGETLIGATIYNMSNNQGCASNSYGFFNINMPLIKFYLESFSLSFF